MKYYKKLEKLINKWSLLYDSNMILQWDSRIMMPERSHLIRSEQISLLSTLQHEILASDEIVELINCIDMRILNDWQRANIREIYRLHTMATKVSQKLATRLVKETAKCEKYWHTRTDQFNQERLEKYFEEVLILTREVAFFLGNDLGLSTYDALLEQHQPGLRDNLINPIFNQIELFTNSLVPIRKKIPEEKIKWPIISKDQQIKFIKKLMTEMKFDFSTGRLDESTHPFTGGIPSDIRITSYFKPDNIMLSISAIMHEIGHASYESRLPKKFRGQPVGDSRGMCFHEAIALFFEKQIGHSEEYLKYLSENISKEFGYLNYFNKEKLKNSFNGIRKSGIRVSADDFSYPAHIIIRYKIEKELISGKLSVKNLNQRWHDLYDSHLGITPSLDQGPWQDIHWAIGLLGYFPCYLIGNIISAQLFNKAQDEILIKNEIYKGKFNKIQKWLDEKIYKKGSYLEFEDLITSSCGKSLCANDFINNLSKRLNH
jgi:carboxypeptidase Taq